MLLALKSTFSAICDHKNFMDDNDDNGIVANGVIVNDTKCSKPQGDSASIYQLSSCMLVVVMIILSPW